MEIFIIAIIFGVALLSISYLAYNRGYDSGYFAGEEDLLEKLRDAAAAKKKHEAQ